MFRLLKSHLLASPILATGICEYNANIELRSCDTDPCFSIIYTITCASFVPIVYFFYPETSGRSLEEIDAIFAESKSIFDTVQVAKQMPKMRLSELARGEKVANTELIESVREEHV